MTKEPIAFFLPNLSGGGAEKVVINLLKEMSQLNLNVDLVVSNTEGPYLNQLPKQVRLVNLAREGVLKSVIPLSRYLKEYRPCVLISHMSHANVVAILASRFARTKTKLILVEHNTLSVDKSKLLRAKFVPMFMKWLYPYADNIVCVSEGVAEDLVFQLGLAKEKVKVIYNPVVNEELIAASQASLNHPWFQQGVPPVFLAVGRLTEQKDFITLLEAFALLRRQTVARLVILGEGELRGKLEAKISQLGIAEDVSLPGFATNPYAYMSKASAFVLSSRWEGLGIVLIEAMACGCPVIATDCPNGPKEILEGGKYGYLPPVGDVVALSKAMLQVLNAPVNRELLRQRAIYFSSKRAVSEYLYLLGNGNNFQNNLKVN
ncbi:glycosyl transferase, group 1 family protein [Calothrix sp. NIES-4071]|nr:glycosyl transferase, group 1 family protein [Calothrix sp. NIES-4071]BAZ58963.1 glycosyl transferase, group 1 family protein [Calothrix sp. NIES-4105]